MEREKIISRLSIYLQLEDIPPTRFEKQIGLSNGYLNKQFQRNGDLGESIINNIIENCPDINPVWLLTGKGEMIQENASPKCKPKMQAQSIENASPNASPIQENATQKLSPKVEPKDCAHSIEKLSPKLSPIQKNDSIELSCQSCIEKDNMIVILKDFIKSKDETINAKNEAVIALNKALTAKDEALIAKDEVIKSKNELIEELLQKDDLDTEDMPVSSAS